jgi:hypothetical protein
MLDENIPENARRLWLRMLQNWVGVTSSLTAVEIELKLNTRGFRQPLETTLNSMVAHGLAEKQVELVPKADSTGERRRVIRTYQISGDSVERVL